MERQPRAALAVILLGAPVATQAWRHRPTPCRRAPTAADLDGQRQADPGDRDVQRATPADVRGQDRGGIHGNLWSQGDAIDGANMRASACVRWDRPAATVNYRVTSDDGHAVSDRGRSPDGAQYRRIGAAVGAHGLRMTVFRCGHSSLGPRC